jgi:hypothetical protein
MPALEEEGGGMSTNTNRSLLSKERQETLLVLLLLAGAAGWALRGQIGRWLTDRWHGLAGQFAAISHRIWIGVSAVRPLLILLLAMISAVTLAQLAGRALEKLDPNGQRRSHLLTYLGAWLGAYLRYRPAARPMEQAGDSDPDRPRSSQP